MDYDNFELLIYLAKKTKLFFSVETSTTKIALDLGISQQTASRKIRALERSGRIQREVSYNGHKIRLTLESIDEIKRHFKELKDLLNKKKKHITGTLKDGLGEGKYYLSLPQYKEAIRKNLGFSPFPGTFNLKVREEEIKPFIANLNKIRIKGFKTKERTFGDIDCYKINLKGENAAIIIPERTRYKDILEIIANFNIRRKFNIDSEQRVKISMPI